eukprot:gnl/Chilomastix_caulleri/5529.p1 GENE.gnl/Chilomastix_caulleri/5529~~gnl/Chilomastix_caulleri/5529.p1  ORF type:complete len:80 (-),score=27.96 gnl/Chilomastix_caulleri/5529:30-269(-)
MISGLCRAVGSTHIPLFDDDESFLIKVDGIKPTLTPPTSMMASRESTFTFSDVGSGVASVSGHTGFNNININTSEYFGW